MTQSTTTSASSTDEARIETARTIALAMYVNCLRAEGIKLPSPNTSGKGPIVNFKGVNTSSPQFKQAGSKCAPTAEAYIKSATR
ncbi:MAG: hypothetical protein WB698_00645 [Solirubrobacteraceae bacterium]